VRAEVGAVGMRLFLEQGFEKTTVDQIAAAAGLSRTSFFRYFATKEDVVLGSLEELGHRVLEAFVARPPQEPVWQALRRTFDVVLEEVAALGQEGLRQARMLNDTPSLKMSQLGKQLTWQSLLLPEVARRIGVTGETLDPRPRALVAAGLACLNAAVDSWNASKGVSDLPRLLDQAMSALTE
jgi:AcrR family transcriptional regulator